LLIEKKRTVPDYADLSKTNRPNLMADCRMVRHARRFLLLGYFDSKQTKKDRTGLATRSAAYHAQPEIDNRRGYRHAADPSTLC
jgi:hypothetical protein